MQTSTPDIDEFATLCQGLVRHVGSSFTRPNDDWVPVILAARSGQLDPYAIEHEWLKTSARKDALVNALKHILAPKQYRFVCFVSSAWMKSVPADYKDNQWLKDHYNRVGIAHDVDKQEALMLSIMSKTAERCFFASIQRDFKTPPTLGDWEMASQVLDNRFLPLREILV